MYIILLSFLLLQLCKPLPARPLPNNLSQTPLELGWGQFAKFANLEKGSNVSGICDLKRYFHRFGYLPPPPPMENFSDNFDSDLEFAIVNYQRNLGLPITGKLDPNTIELIMSPRCGMVDSHHPNPAMQTTMTMQPHQTRHFAYFNGQPRWSKSSPMTLTYTFSQDHMINYLTQEQISTAFRRSFSRWSEVIPVNFTEVHDHHRKADIRIGFYGGDHGDGEPFDGVLGVLAHAFSPQNGRLHLDASERWAVDFDKEDSRVAVDLESVATHEIGHVLGLAHSSISDAIMYPSLRPRSKKVDLRVDDVQGVQALYGSNPNFNYESLLEYNGREMSNSATRLGGNNVKLFGLLTWWFCTIVLSLIHLIFV